MSKRGQVLYVTLRHTARCRDCPWRGKPFKAGRDKPSLVRVRNNNALTHAQKHGHCTVCEIDREFNRRPNAVAR